MMEWIFIGEDSSNKSHMPHLHGTEWGRLKPSTEAPAPNVPFVPEILSNMSM